MAENSEDIHSDRNSRVGPLLAPLSRIIHRQLDRMPPVLAEFVLFGLKQAWACLFAGMMLALLILTKLIWQPDWPVNRYDALFVMALLIQVSFLLLRLESFAEARVIFIYHVVGTAMEVFKTGVGSWTYPEDAIFRIGGVPLFSGFMYACIGSYMARVIRICDMRFTHYPPFWLTIVLAVAIYVNFYAHHYLWDSRYLLMLATVLIFGRVRIYFTVDKTARWMPLVLAAFLTACFLWVAENVGTATGTWLYPGHKDWSMVSLGKLGSWYLLLYVSFVLVTLVLRPRDRDAA